MKISIIIPTYNESGNIVKLVNYLQQHRGENIAEIIVSDGGSQDDTIRRAKEAEAKIVSSPTKGRAAQMNYAASIAKGDILYFIHADTLPPVTYAPDIEKMVRQGFDLGRYRTKFDSSKWILKVNAFFTRFDWFMCMGGDQTLFITKKLFDQAGGFDGSMKIMEEYEFCERARRYGKYKIMQNETLVSARKYDANSWYKVQRANYTIIKMFKKGLSQDEMVKKYKEMLDYR